MRADRGNLVLDPTWCGSGSCKEVRTASTGNVGKERRHHVIGNPEAFGSRTAAHSASSAPVRAHDGSQHGRDAVRVRDAKYRKGGERRGHLLLLPEFDFLFS